MATKQMRLFSPLLIWRLRQKSFLDSSAPYEGGWFFPSSLFHWRIWPFDLLVPGLHLAVKAQAPWLWNWQPRSRRFLLFLSLFMSDSYRCPLLSGELGYAFTRRLLYLIPAFSSEFCGSSSLLFVRKICSKQHF